VFATGLNFAELQTAASDDAAPVVRLARLSVCVQQGMG
jgi:hypothetical protein